MTKKRVHETLAADRAGRGVVMLAEHRWERDEAGALVHTVDGFERAHVAPEHVDAYLAAWPEAAAALTG